MKLTLKYLTAWLILAIGLVLIIFLRDEFVSYLFIGFGIGLMFAAVNEGGDKNERGNGEKQ